MVRALPWCLLYWGAAQCVPMLYQLLWERQPCSANMRSSLYLPYPTSAAAAPGRGAAWPDPVAQCLALVCQALTILCPPGRWWLSGQPVRCVRGTVSQLQRCPSAPAILCAHLQSGLASHCLPVQARGVSQQSLGCLPSLNACRAIGWRSCAFTWVVEISWRSVKGWRGRWRGDCGGGCRTDHARLVKYLCVLSISPTG